MSAKSILVPLVALLVGGGAGVAGTVALRAPVTKTETVIKEVFISPSPSASPRVSPAPFSAQTEDRKALCSVAKAKSGGSDATVTVLYQQGNYAVTNTNRSGGYGYYRKQNNTWSFVDGGNGDTTLFSRMKEAGFPAATTDNVSTLRPIATC